jgi:hypothetical protein
MSKKTNLIGIDEIFPAKINGQIYKPILPDDPATISLAKSIQRHDGLLEKIRLTLDNVILSGHRRTVACRLLGWTEIPVVRENILSTDAEFPALLVAYNETRVKNPGELFNEAIVNQSPEDAANALQKYNDTRSAMLDKTMLFSEFETVTADSRIKKRGAVSKDKADLANAILEIFENIKGALSVRQVHYQLLNGRPKISIRSGERYENTKECYQNQLIAILAKMRKAGLIPYERIIDETRPEILNNFFGNSAEFIKREYDNFLGNYYRNLTQSQPHHIEIICEKLTLKNLIHDTTAEFTVPLTIGRGYSSLSALHRIAARYRKSGKDRLILLILSDLDPDGDAIATSLTRTFRDEFDIPENKIMALRVALSPQQVDELSIPPQMTAKKSSSKYQGFVRERGSDAVYELEAVPPEKLKELLRDAITSVLDKDLYNAEIRKERQEQSEIIALKSKMQSCLCFLKSEVQP